MEYTRKQLQEMFPTYKIRIRQIDFTDLARASAFTLTVLDADGRKVNGGNCFSAEHYEKYKAVFDNLNALKAAKATFRGLHLLT